MVLWQDQADWGREEAVDCSKRARRLPHPRLRVQAERLLALSQGRRHRQALQNPAVGRGRLLHSEEDDLQDVAGARRSLQQGCGRPLRQPPKGLHSGECWKRLLSGNSQNLLRRIIKIFVTYRLKLKRIYWSNKFDKYVQKSQRRQSQQTFIVTAMNITTPVYL